MDSQVAEELEVVAAIFENDIDFVRSVGSSSSHNRAHSRLFSARLCLNPPLPIHVCNASSGARSIDSYTAFPPLVLRVSLPKTYPETCAPTFHIEAPFLSLRMLSRLVEKLTTMFQPGETVIYKWFTFILEEAWQTIIEPESTRAHERMLSRNDAAITTDDGAVLVLELDDFNTIGDVPSHFRQSVTRTPYAFGSVQKMLMDYCDRVDFEMLRHSRHTCASCMEERDGRDCVILRRCRHVSCKSCLSGFWSARISDGLVTEEQIVCMEIDCRTGALPMDVALVVPIDMYERYERLQLDSVIATLPDTVYCARPKCGKPATLDKEVGTLGRCAYCHFSFCSQCSRSWHGTAPCVTDALGGTGEGATEGSGADSEGEESVEESEKDVVSRRPKFKATKLMLKLGVRPCPQCGVLVVRDGGCMHMTCRICCEHWCWNCGDVMDVLALLFRCRNGCEMHEDERGRARYDQLLGWLAANQYNEDGMETT